MIRTITLNFDGAGGAYVIDFNKRVKLLKLSGIVPPTSVFKFKTPDVATSYVDANDVTYQMGTQTYENSGSNSVYMEHIFHSWNVLAFGWVDGAGGSAFPMTLTFDDYE